MHTSQARYNYYLVDVYSKKLHRVIETSLGNEGGASGGKSGEALVPAWHAEVAHPERTTVYAAPSLTAVASMHHNEAASCGIAALCWQMLGAKASPHMYSIQASHTWWQVFPFGPTQCL